MKLRDSILAKDLRRWYRLGWTHRDVQGYLRDFLGISVSLRTLKRWKRGLEDPLWKGPIPPQPPRPKTIPAQVVSKVCRLRQQTGWGSYSLRILCGNVLSESSCKRIIRLNGLSRGSMILNKRIHWVKWQREHPDSLWQIDSWRKPDGKWVIDVIDDCSRFCLGIREVAHLTTQEVTSFLEEIISTHGLPREVLTDSGSEHGMRSTMSQFDLWCKAKGIEHIRSRVHKPTTAGKVERFHQTVQMELPFCHNDYELFRYRYNHVRPHQSLLGKRPAEVYFDLAIRLNGSSVEQPKWWG